MGVMPKVLRTMSLIGMGLSKFGIVGGFGRCAVGACKKEDKSEVPHEGIGHRHWC